MDHENLEFGCLQWKHRVLVAIPFLCMAAVATSGAKAQSLTLHQIEQLAPRCAPNVAMSTLAAIGETESHLKPLSIHDNTTGLSAVFSRRSDALEVTSKLVAVGDSVDVGLMQVNSRNFGSLGLTLAAAFDPCQSMEAGATILTQDYAGGPDYAGQQAALRVALSRYNTGDPARGFANGYVHRVEMADALVVPALDPASVTQPRPSLTNPTFSYSTDWDVFPADNAATRVSRSIARFNEDQAQEAGVSDFPAPTDIKP
jgi:type IV secretion system protein VirB1